jgi:hypothetical protein
LTEKFQFGKIIFMVKHSGRIREIDGIQLNQRLPPYRELINNKNFVKKPDEKDISNTKRELQSLLAKFSQDQETSLKTVFDAAEKLAEAKGDNKGALLRALEFARQSALKAIGEKSLSSKDVTRDFLKINLTPFERLNKKNYPLSIVTPEQIEARKARNVQLMRDWAEVTRPIIDNLSRQPFLRKTLTDALLSPSFLLDINHN